MTALEVSLLSGEPATVAEEAASRTRIGSDLILRKSERRRSVRRPAADQRPCAVAQVGTLRRRVVPDRSVGAVPVEAGCAPGAPAPLERDPREGAGPGFTCEHITVRVSPV